MQGADIVIFVTWGCNVMQGKYDPPGLFTAECNAGMWLFQVWLVSVHGSHGGLMISVLDSGASGPGSSPGRGHCVVFLGKTLYSHGASLHPGE